MERTKRRLEGKKGPIMATCTFIDLDKEIRIPETAWTLEGFRKWAKSEDFPKRGRISFIGGEIVVDMSPEELNTHNFVKGEIGRVIANLNVALDLGVFLSDRTLVTNVDAELSTEPDAGFVIWEALESGRVRLVPREDTEGEYMDVEGSPDWLLEIVSKSSVRKDTQLLREKYHRARIPEYWLIDARGKKLNFQILHWEKDSYVLAPVRGGWQRSQVFSRSFKLERRRGRAGLWQYTLHVKPE